jgi:hypothetical protein
VILTLKTLIWWNLLEKREAFLYEKAKKNRYLCGTLRAYSII